MQPAAPLAPHLDDFRPLFERLAPIRYGSTLRFPRLVWQVLRNKRRDVRTLQAEVRTRMTAVGGSLPEETLAAYIDSMVLLHYLQRSGVAVHTMMKPELMESLAAECLGVLQADVPGALVDVGVWKGGSAIIMKAVNDRLGAGRPVTLLDLFDTMDTAAVHDEDPVGDRVIIAALDHARGYFGTEGVRTSIDEVRDNFRAHGVGLDGVSFVRGNLTAPDFPFDQVGDIALLRIDCDFYTATRNTLAGLFDKVQPGGVIIFDDYFLEAFGERQAADELRARLGHTRPLERVGQSAIWRLPP